MVGDGGRGRLIGRGSHPAAILGRGLTQDTAIQYLHLYFHLIYTFCFYFFHYFPLSCFCFLSRCLPCFIPCFFPSFPVYFGLSSYVAFCVPSFHVSFISTMFSFLPTCLPMLPSFFSSRVPSFLLCFLHSSHVSSFVLCVSFYLSLHVSIVHTTFPSFLFSSFYVAFLPSFHVYFFPSILPSLLPAFHAFYVAFLPSTQSTQPHIFTLYLLLRYI